MGNGWVKIHRILSENPLWTCEPFSRGQAWVDLILLANHSDSFFFRRGVKINIARGQVGHSEVALSDRWQWSRTKVRKFLNDLEKEQQIVQQKSNTGQVVTLLNYETYQAKEQQNGQQKDSRKTAEKHKQECKELIKNEKKDNTLSLNQNFKEEADRYKIMFDEFRIKYPSNKKGLETEFSNMRKKHKDYQEVIPTLLPSLELQIERRRRLKEAGSFVPEWKHLTTWINNRCWEEEIPEEAKPKKFLAL